MVLDAFSAAYGGGRESWETMTEGVLKNRLLQMSDRSFRVEDFGVDSLDSFIDLVPGTLERVEPSTPRSVRLTASGKSTVVDRGPGGTASGRHGRVREDLWNAILDYSAHGTWIWDPDAGEAVLTDEATGWTPECQLPTVTPDDLAAWRSDFANGLEGISADQLRLVQEWSDRGLGTNALPALLRRPWSAVLKQNVLDRLDKWFSETSFGRPDLFENEPARPLKGHKRSAEDELRVFIQHCVSLMTETELQSLPIPADVAFRATRR